VSTSEHCLSLCWLFQKDQKAESVHAKVSAKVLRFCVQSKHCPRLSVSTSYSWHSSASSLRSRPFCEIAQASGKTLMLGFRGLMVKPYNLDAAVGIEVDSRSPQETSIMPMCSRLLLSLKATISGVRPSSTVFQVILYLFP
jgi:hypothetical protein